MEKEKLVCQNCGATLKFAPGTTSLVCEYCGTTNVIEKAKEEIREIDFNAFLTRKMVDEETQEILTVKCQICGAEITFKPNITSDECPFCGSGIVVTNKLSKKILKPKSVLPFKITKKEAQLEFKKWLSSLWFAPNKLKYYARDEEGLSGIYIPFWTYDSHTQSDYQGQRGDDYYVTESYTTVEDGKTVTKTRQVRHTRWSYASGHVSDNFDDILIMASNSLPRKYADLLEPWDLVNLVPYKDEYLSGFRAESYQINLENGFELAKEVMYEEICHTIRDDIGGDHQQISNVDTTYSEITFKHLLLPVWISAYRYGDKVYRFMVNARTGEVQGERPWSKVKIGIAVIFGLIIVLTILYFNRENLVSIISSTR